MNISEPFMHIRVASQTNILFPYGDKFLTFTPLHSLTP